MDTSWSPPIAIELHTGKAETFEISADPGVQTPAIIENLGPHPLTISTERTPVQTTPSPTPVQPKPVQVVIKLLDQGAAAFVVFNGNGRIAGDGARARITLAVPFK